MNKAERKKAQRLLEEIKRRQDINQRTEKERLIEGFSNEIKAISEDIESYISSKSKAKEELEEKLKEVCSRYRGKTEEQKVKEVFKFQYAKTMFNVFQEMNNIELNLIK